MEPVYLFGVRGIEYESQVLFQSLGCFHESTIRFTSPGYRVLSVILLVAANNLFSVLSIHKNLATAFVFRFAVLAIWTIVQSTNLFQDCSRFHPQPLWELEWICQAILWFVIYFQVASVMWMLIEGAFLYSRFTVFAMRHTSIPNSFCWGTVCSRKSSVDFGLGTMGSALIVSLDK
ncbi:hypothetical protein CAEBREN_17044 [Caenorhabditis brenneri]|uniref:Uncharacterized protein n=1 Tax=Caenorhabditis brenneri TaxID=135651 RepID=G0NVM1_CAEBE|nr:hypothetical protein CAEBREN_17044 [Caenorhabditis brenneri]